MLHGPAEICNAFALAPVLAGEERLEIPALLEGVARDLLDLFLDEARELVEVLLGPSQAAAPPLGDERGVELLLHPVVVVLDEGQVARSRRQAACRETVLLVETMFCLTDSNSIWLTLGKP